MKPECVKSGERARLFPILSETSKEGRTTSIFLATMTAVREFGTRLLSSVGQRAGKTSRIGTWTEITFDCGPREPDLGRPDGLIVLDTGRRKWTALVEAKVGKSELTAEQVKRYLQLAKKNKIDAVITISNQFSAFPQHHPIAKDIGSTKGVELYHWSWMHILTEAELLTENGEVVDEDQALLLSEFKRFITHESAGVRGFDRMPSSWTSLVQNVQAGGRLTRSGAVEEAAEAWQQECRDLCLILSRQLKCEVTQRLSRAAASDPAKRFEDDVRGILEDHQLAVTLVVPDAAADIDVVADLLTRNIQVSMSLAAPGDRVRNTARLNWLMKQLPEKGVDDVHVRCKWPTTSPATQETVETWRNDPALIDEGKGKMQCWGFDVIEVTDVGARFGSQKPFIDALEAAVADFYNDIGQHLKAWQARAPRVDRDRDSVAKVSPAAISQDAEAEASGL
ncbi:hypothetical protein [Sphingomicrobium arenosum]|uniref:hypothetical protein n=1 Tax=Sphingomicrobium arenosum TaxID=2233861 RepID=UPI002240EFE3|nr:hypothetical protein [Sphingomicrobium arenosum]